jgi:pilus assembly protein CpaD
MRSKLAIIALACTGLAGCNTPENPAKGMAAVNIPVVTTADYVFDAATPAGSLDAGEAARLDGWFQGLGVSYGDVIYVDGPDSAPGRAQVASIAGHYGMMVSPGAPMTAGVVPPGSLRIVVSRRRAEVPGCPNWSVASQPNWDNSSMSNYGCSVNTNIAAMVANPEDLLHGREGTGVGDTLTAAKAVQLYRATPPTGSKGLQDISPKGK